MPLAGRLGTVKYTSSTGGSPALVADLRSWELDISYDMFEISTFGSSGWKEHMPNMAGAQGTIEGYWNIITSTSERAIQNKVLGLSTSPGTFAFIVDAANGNGYTGDAWITNIRVGAAVDAIVPFSAGVTVHGAVAFSTTIA